MLDTILFDMDGTLIDTEGYYNRCWVQAIREAGYKMTPKRALELRSLGRPTRRSGFREILDRMRITRRSGADAKS